MNFKIKRKLKKVERKLKSILRETEPNFEIDNIVDKNLKILIFIVYLINAYVPEQSIEYTISSLINKKIYPTYIDMMNFNQKLHSPAGLLNKITFLQSKEKSEIIYISSFSSTISRLIEMHLSENDVKISLKMMTDLLDLTIKYFLINYHCLPYKTKIESNLSNFYRERTESSLLQCEYICEIHRLLKQMMPTKINQMAIIINLMSNSFIK
ncbi:MAG: hypothetical protein LBJ97_02305 [Mycoplasmataceae bacterium]|jgi:hypothetical protein|nr:hypothetical protein [Mycoplasmataceae bacterium]